VALLHIVDKIWNHFCDPLGVTPGNFTESQRLCTGWTELWCGKCWKIRLSLEHLQGKQGSSFCHSDNLKYWITLCSCFDIIPTFCIFVLLHWILNSIFTVHFSSIDNVFHQLNALVIKTLKYSKHSKYSKPKHVGAFYQTILEYFSVFISSAFSWWKTLSVHWIRQVGFGQLCILRL
jgi:hypothetical protein